MLPSERKQKILSLLRDRNEMSVKVLARTLGAAPANVRRDLRELESEKRIDRRHGRAIFRASSLPTPIDREELELDPGLLDELVEASVQTLSEARNLFLGGGPVLTRVAQKLSKKTIATHDLSLAMVAAAADNDVTLAGREIDNRTLTVRANGVDALLAQFWFDAAVFEVDGVDEKNLWLARKDQAFLDAVLKRSDSFVSIAKSTVLGHKGDRVAGPLTSTDLVVIDRGLSDGARRALANAGVELLVAGEAEDEGYVLEGMGSNVFSFKSAAGRFGAPAPGELDDEGLALAGLDEDSLGDEPLHDEP